MGLCPTPRQRAVPFGIPCLLLEEYPGEGLSPWQPFGEGGHLGIVAHRRCLGRAGNQNHRLRTSESIIEGLHALAEASHIANGAFAREPIAMFSPLEASFTVTEASTTRAKLSSRSLKLPQPLTKPLSRRPRSPQRKWGFHRGQPDLRRARKTLWLTRFLPRRPGTVLRRPERRLRRSIVFFVGRRRGLRDRASGFVFREGSFRCQNRSLALLWKPGR